MAQQAATTADIMGWTFQSRSWVRVRSDGEDGDNDDNADDDGDDADDDDGTVEEDDVDTDDDDDDDDCEHGGGLEVKWRYIQMAIK